jgi:hypothetical protein
MDAGLRAQPQPKPSCAVVNLLLGKSHPRLLLRDRCGGLTLPLMSGLCTWRGHGLFELSSLSLHSAPGAGAAETGLRLDAALSYFQHRVPGAALRREGSFCHSARSPDESNPSHSGSVPAKAWPLGLAP